MVRLCPGLPPADKTPVCPSESSPLRPPTCLLLAHAAPPRCAQVPWSVVSRCEEVHNSLCTVAKGVLGMSSQGSGLCQADGARQPTRAHASWLSCRHLQLRPSPGPQPGSCDLELAVATETRTHTSTSNTMSRVWRLGPALLNLFYKGPSFICGSGLG